MNHCHITIAYLSDTMRQVLQHMHGRSAASAIAAQLEGKYVIRDEPPSFGKDCNDHLQHLQRQKHSRQMG